MLLLPVGRTMKGIDIYGLAEDGRRIFGQVTYGISKSSQGRKEDVLRGYGTEDKYLVLFGSYEAVHEHDGILCCPITTVYHYFSETEHGKAWINLPR